MQIGVLAVQGAFIEHIHMLEKLGVSCIELRQKSYLDGIDGVVLPGGESTVQGQLLKKLDMFEPLQEMIKNGLPTLATCAGLILLAGQLENDDVHHLATLPVTVRRNAYGRQLGSFTTTADAGDIADFPMVFIRAPFITSADDDVKVLSRVGGNIVAVEYRNQLGLSFHPEMSGDTRIHEYFIRKIQSGTISA